LFLGLNSRLGGIWYNLDMQKDETVRVLRRYFRSHPVLKAYLFGSVARGDDDQDSDVDILVELDRTRPIGLEYIQIHLDLEKLLKRKVDLITQKSVSKFIRPYIDQEKELIYER